MNNDIFSKLQSVIDAISKKSLSFRKNYKNQDFNTKYTSIVSDLIKHATDQIAASEENSTNSKRNLQQADSV